MPSLMGNIGCCGGKELRGMNDTNLTMKSLILTYTDAENVNYNQGDPKGLSWVVFSYAWVSRKYVHNSGNILHRHALLLINKGASEEKCVIRFDKFKRYIDTHKLGTVSINSGCSPNPHMEGITSIRAGIWYPDNEAVFKYVTKTTGWRQKNKAYYNGVVYE